MDANVTFDDGQLYESIKQTGTSSMQAIQLYIMKEKSYSDFASEAKDLAHILTDKQKTDEMGGLQITRCCV